MCIERQGVWEGGSDGHEEIVMMMMMMWGFFYSCVCVCVYGSHTQLLTLPRLLPGDLLLFSPHLTHVCLLSLGDTYEWFVTFFLYEAAAGLSLFPCPMSCSLSLSLYESLLGLEKQGGRRMAALR